MPIIILAIVGLVLLAKGTQTPANGKQNTPPPTPPPPPKVDNTTRDVIGGATAILPVAVKVGATIAGATGAGTALAGGGATTVYTVETTGEATGLISETTAETTEVVTISGSTILAAGIFLLFVAAVITTITLYGLDAANALFRYKIVGRTNKGVQLEACNALEMMVLVGYQPTFISPDANQVTAHATCLTKLVLNTACNSDACLTGNTTARAGTLVTSTKCGKPLSRLTRLRGATGLVASQLKPPKSCLCCLWCARLIGNTAKSVSKFQAASQQCTAEISTHQ